MAPAATDAPPAVLRLTAQPVRWRLLRELAQSDRRVRELTSSVAEDQPLVSYHLGLLRAGGLVSARRSSFDGRDSYYSLDLARCGELLGGAGAAPHPGPRDATAQRAPARRAHLRGRNPAGQVQRRRRPEGDPIERQ